MNRIVLLASQIVDGTDKPPITDGGILIEGARIKAIGRQGEFAQLADAKVINLEGWTLLPGLMDAHIHLDGWETTNRFDWVVMPDAQRALNAAAYAKRALDAGFTFVRDAGSNIGVSLKRAIDEGKVPGPQMRVSVKGIYQTNGQGDRGVHADRVGEAKRKLCVGRWTDRVPARGATDAAGGRGLYQDCHLRWLSLRRAALYAGRSFGDVR